MNYTADLRNVTKVYQTHSNKNAALEEASLTASKGEMLLLLGPSGSGKTTLLTITAGFTKPTSGSVILFGKDIKDYSAKELQALRAERIGFIFQTFLLIDALNVFENVALVLRFSKLSHKEMRHKTLEALNKVGISHLAKKRPSELSHGERQRAAIARAFANDASLLIADEPTASLETKQGEGIIHLLHSYASDYNKCVIAASHDLRLKSFADNTYYMENGRITSFNFPFLS